MKIISVVLPILIAVHAIRLYDSLGINKDLGPNKPQGCALIASDILGVEDLVQYRPGILIGTAAGVFVAEQQGPQTREPGYLILVDGRNGKLPLVRKLRVQNLPDMWFIPHGIFYSANTERVYVVNHAVVSGQGTRVEVFAVKSDEEGLPQLKWLMSIGGKDTFFDFALNSVVEGSENEIYVTQWQSTPVPKKGSLHPETWQEVLSRIVQLLLTFFMLPGNQGIYRCTFDAETFKTEATQCKIASWYFVGANGLTISQDLTRVYLVDLYAHKIYSHSRNRTNGDLTLLLNETINCPHAIDNVHYDAETGELHTGTIPKISQILNHEPVSGTFQVFSKSNNAFNFYDKVEQRVVHDGSLLSEFSVCMPLKVSNASWSLCGGPVENGLLICPA